MPRPYFDSNDKIEEIMRVNHAGEFGAQKIYYGQLKFTKNIKDKIIIKEMLEQELEHLHFFENEIKHKQLRPTLLLPMWDIFGYMLGAVSGILGNRAAMVVTESVEEVIIEHYQEQIDHLSVHDKTNPLLGKIIKFQSDEAEHIEIAVKNDSRKSMLRSPISKLVQAVCHSAIMLSKKL